MENNSLFEKFMEMAGKVPGVQVSREDFLRTTFKHQYKNANLDKIVKMGPIAAGVSSEDISKIANQVIYQETIGATWKSVLTGIPGGVLGVAAIPADIAQYYAHTFIVIQKLMYLYGWGENVFNEYGSLDDTTKNAIILYVGLMFGVKEAGKVLAEVSVKYFSKGAVKYIGKAIFTKGIARNLIKKIVEKIGIISSAKLVHKGITKGIPIAGGVISGGWTVATFIPMSKKLKKHFETGKVIKGDIE